MSGQDSITIPESTLKDVVSAQLAAKFSDPEIIRAFVASILDTHVDVYGRVSSRSTDPTLLRHTIEGVVRRFIEETAKAWFEDQRDELLREVGKALGDAGVIQRIAKETAQKVSIK